MHVRRDIGKKAHVANKYCRYLGGHPESKARSRLLSKFDKWLGEVVIV